MRPGAGTPKMATVRSRIGQVGGDPRRIRNKAAQLPAVVRERANDHSQFLRLRVQSAHGAIDRGPARNELPEDRDTALVAAGVGAAIERRAPVVGHARTSPARDAPELDPALASSRSGSMHLGAWSAPATRRCSSCDPGAAAADAVARRGVTARRWASSSAGLPLVTPRTGDRLAGRTAGPDHRRAFALGLHRAARRRTTHAGARGVCRAQARRGPVSRRTPAGVRMYTCQA